MSDTANTRTTDIASRLRDQAKLRRSMDAAGHQTNMLDEAADEIERLRADVAMWRNQFRRENGGL